MDPVVAVEGLDHAYGDVTAVRDVDIAVDRGEIFVLIGPNGAGKTTLVRAITGTIRPDSGDVTVLGATPEAVRKSRIGLLPQSFSPPARLTGAEIIEYYGGLYEDSRATDAVLADVGMAGSADRWYERLSGGQQRRICVGTALVNDPDLLILDEPTTGIDPRGRRRIWQLLQKLRADGRTVVLTTHDMAEAESLADRVGLMSEGELVTVGEPDALVDEYAGHSRLVVTPEEPVEAMTIEGMPHDIQTRNGALVYPDMRPREVGDALDALEAANVSYSRFVWEEPGLEDVYLQLTDERIDT